MNLSGRSGLFEALQRIIKQLSIQASEKINDIYDNSIVDCKMSQLSHINNLK